MPLYADAREFFEAVAEANRDAERVRSQLDALEHHALGMGGGFGPRVRSTPAHDRMGEAVASLVDQESALGWVQHDMVVTSNWHHDAYDRFCPDGWELDYRGAISVSDFNACGLEHLPLAEE